MTSYRITGTDLGGGVLESFAMTVEATNQMEAAAIAKMRRASLARHSVVVDAVWVEQPKSVVRPTSPTE